MPKYANFATLINFNKKNYQVQSNIKTNLKSISIFTKWVSITKKISKMFKYSFHKKNR